MSNIKIISPGIQTSIQDLGRFGFRSHGIPLSGAMDQSAFRLANILVGNDENEAALECTMMGPKIEFTSDSYIAITGANVDVYINEIQQKMNATLSIEKGSILKFGRIHEGCRYYIAFANGINVKSILGSKSTDTISDIGHPILKKHDTLSLAHNEEERLFIELNSLIDNLTSRIVKAYPGPEYSLIQDVELDKITLTIDASSNRMAYVLHSDLKITHRYEMVSSGVLPGTIQLTPNGQWNILMRDAQTTGGYPRILQICEKDLDYLAQRRGGEKIRITMTNEKILF